MLDTELQKIYDSEISVEISWLWDGGIDVKLGDEMNGYRAQTNIRDMAEIIPWLQRAMHEARLPEFCLANREHTAVKVDIGVRGAIELLQQKDASALKVR